ncbi:hypothetical protein [Pedobacter sp. FW305-3-2-15-E-R2A2]|uniref:hypothetical protein n=1 Tax=Pedobacter sp. FW305-3-2-15-E-R2A2 TaxID=3140251 RepID=UPI0031404F0B
MNLIDLQQYIRFHIGQLSANNGSADFEKICLYYARLRIHRNILPATGPVQAGGDQGRDFETFHTYLSNTEIARSSFLAADSAGAVAFACSLQKDPTKKNGKVVSDVRVITSGGTKVERVYFFSGEDIPVAARHKVQEYVKKEFGIALEIFDAQALAMQLCDPDLFWIAAQFLNVSSEVFPERLEENWYEVLKKEYQQRKRPLSTFQEFEEVKGAIRHIYKKDQLKSDLTFWFPKLDEVISNPLLPSQLVRKSIYEKFVTSLVGLDFVEGQEENIEKYFKDFEAYLATPDLEDAQNLLSFCNNSLYLSRHKLSEDFLDEISGRMDTLLTSLLKDAHSIDHKAMLLEIRANFILNDRRSNKDILDNYDDFIDALDELLECLQETHFFPISQLSNRLNEYIRIFLRLDINLEDLEEITADVDDVYLKKGGMAAAGGKLRDRAVIYLKSGHHDKAIKLLHELKLKWFNKDTQEGMILTCLLLSDTYYKMDLLLAAKYFALVSAYIAHKSRETALSDKVVMGINMVMNCDYARGAWLSYLRLVPILLGTHEMMTKDFDLFEHEDSLPLLYYPAVIFESARRYIPKAMPILDETINAASGLKIHIQKFQDDFKKTLDDEQFKLKLAQEIPGSPFNDLGIDHEFLFNASGCDWHFSFKNDFLTTAIAEEFICTFQILLSEVSAIDFNFLPGKARIHLVWVQSGKCDIEEVEIEDDLAMLVKLSRFSGKTPADRSKHIFNQIVCAQALLYQRSMLSKENYEPLIAPVLKNHEIISKVSFGQSYENVFREFYDKSWFDANRMIGVWTPFGPEAKKVPKNTALRERRGISQVYDSANAMERIQNRINNLQKPLSVSLPILITQAWFQEIITELRADGWLDWQILHALGHIVVNHKAKAHMEVNLAKAEQQRKRHFDLLSKDEKEWYQAVDKSIITFDQLTENLQNMVPLVVLQAFGLENKSYRPDMPLIREFLKDRFQFFEDGKEIDLFSSAK